MSLNMYIGEVEAQTESMNAFCNATIQGMEEVIRSIDAFALDVTLKGKTYESAKTFFMQTYRQLAQGIIYLCEELIVQNNAFPADFQAEVATVDVVEQEIREQIRELEQMIAAIAAMDEQTPETAAMLQIYHAMKRKLEDKLERLYQFNYSSSENYRTAIELASSIAKGLAEVQSGKGFQAVSGTFHTERLNMEWAKPIQLITEEKARKADNKTGENKEFTEEEVQAVQQYLEGIKDGTIKGNIDKDFHVETDAYEMEHNIFGRPVGGGKPTLDPYLVNIAQFGFDFFISDLLTLFDSEATPEEKLLAMGFMTPQGKLGKTLDKLNGLKKSGNVKKDSSGSVDGDKGTVKDKPFGKYSTAIDDKVKVIEKVDLADWISESFTDGNYRTVVTEENITFYRTYGGGAKAGGAFVTTSPAGNRINAKISTALVPDWKNSRQYEAVIEVPKGQILNIGRVEKQYTKTGALLEGDGDQILLPQGWPSEWIKETREVPSR
ncbi:hypothetical protein BAMA_16570 [Bacillus manliponensis]|uniref:LXG domain-containing protein n=1 Tax=Bacillus manliponensis TaxID=574376 RepID=A0A073K0J1_9BACI|nr:T7SS effector LXG polymorphic toxin [Bacillus manliponensis]KEK20071.1 hypothetical protein BAMA_16570 [Bacillus manliponensis]